MKYCSLYKNTFYFLILNSNLKYVTLYYCIISYPLNDLSRTIHRSKGLKKLGSFLQNIEHVEKKNILSTGRVHRNKKGFKVASFIFTFLQ